MKKNLLSIAVGATFLAASSTSVFAATHGNLGDSRIHYPLANANIFAPSTDVWFVAAKDADFYTIDLRQYDPENGGCGHPSAGKDYRMAKMFKVNDPALQCGAEIVSTLATKGVIGYYDETDDQTGNGEHNQFDKFGDANQHLCKWHTPDLPNGDYQIAINSIKLGYHSVTENRFNCLSDLANTANVAVEVAWAAANLVTTGVAALASAAALNIGPYELGNPDTFGKVDRRLGSGLLKINKHRDPSTYTISSTLIGGDRNYQKFKISTPPGATTYVDNPYAPNLVQPGNGTAVKADGTTILEFIDLSPDDRTANWYELWITPDAGAQTEENRIKDFDANAQYPGWFKLLVDASELSCSQNSGVGRTCEIKLNSPTIAGAAAGTKYNWWVRGYNPVVGTSGIETGPWSQKGMFVAD